MFRRLRTKDVRACWTVTVTVRSADFLTQSRFHTDKRPLASQEALEARALQLLLPFLDARENPRRKKRCLIGVRVEKLVREEAPEGIPELITPREPHDRG